MNGPENLFDSPIESAAVPEVRNHTRFPSQYFQMMDTSDALFHVMVTRLTYDLRSLDSAGYPALAGVQTELVDSDEYHDEINLSSTVQESDYAPFKPKCDVLFANATAYAPLVDGKRKPLERFPAGVRIELADGTEWQKLVHVTGARTLSVGALGGFKLSEPEPTLGVEIRYEYAFGGTNQWWKGWPTAIEADQRFEIDIHHPMNPVGCGVIDPTWRSKGKLPFFPAPQIEAYNVPFTAAHAERAATRAMLPEDHAKSEFHEPSYPVVGLGAIGRWWQPRRAKAGSYNELWKQTRWPKLPEDFDFGYWNAAPEDQQIDYPKGGERVLLVNLIHPNYQPSASMWFRIPKTDLHQRVRLHSGPRFTQPMVIDTVIIDLEAMQLILVHRATTPAAAEVRVIEVGIGNGGDGSDGSDASNAAARESEVSNG